MQPLFSIVPSYKLPFTIYLLGRAKNTVHVEKGINRIAEHFNFKKENTDEFNTCKYIFDAVLISCHQTIKEDGSRLDYTNAKEFEEGFQVFRKSIISN